MPAQKRGPTEKDQDMSSILTNTSAMVALQTMKNINNKGRYQEEFKESLNLG